MASEERIWLLISKAVSGEISPAELEEMEAIFIAEPERRSDYEHICQLKLTGQDNISPMERRAMERGLDKFNEVYAENAFVERPLFNMELEPLRHRGQKRWMIAAASVIALMAVGLFAVRFLRSDKSAAPQLLVAGYGKRIQSTLPDGSVMWLNSGSSVKYVDNTETGKREVTLNGEAYFDVKHDPLHPFVVHAGKLNVVVLGTAFDVKAYTGDAYIETTLIRGKVEILNDARPGTSIVLYPNQTVRVNTEKNSIKKALIEGKQIAPDSVSIIQGKTPFKPAAPDESIDETAWVNNQLTFKKEDFSDLALQLERWYNVNITFDNDKYASKQFTGKFKNQDIDEVMHALQLTQPFQYSITNNQIHIW